MVSAIGGVSSVKNVHVYTNPGVYVHNYLCVGSLSVDESLSYWGDVGLHVPNVK